MRCVYSSLFLHTVFSSRSKHHLRNVLFAVYVFIIIICKAPFQQDVIPDDDVTSRSNHTFNGYTSKSSPISEPHYEDTLNSAQLSWWFDGNNSRMLDYGWENGYKPAGLELATSIASFVESEQWDAVHALLQTSKDGNGDPFWLPEEHPFAAAIRGHDFHNLTVGAHPVDVFRALSIIGVIPIDLCQYHSIRQCLSVGRFRTSTADDYVGLDYSQNQQRLVMELLQQRLHRIRFKQCGLQDMFQNSQRHIYAVGGILVNIVNEIVELSEIRRKIGGGAPGMHPSHWIHDIPNTTHEDYQNLLDVWSFVDYALVGHTLHTPRNVSFHNYDVSIVVNPRYIFHFTQNRVEEDTLFMKRLPLFIENGDGVIANNILRLRNKILRNHVQVTNTLVRIFRGWGRLVWERNHLP
eukprot:PhF_6_TR20826/c0_g1_i1/m.29978